jgi:carbonic anhydrase/acetyltransferase-like protein (isoleucine patch superfamily)
MAFYEIIDGSQKPVVGSTTWVADSADIIGNVTIGENCYIGWGAVIRADYGTVVIEDGTAIEENVTIHAWHGGSVRIGREVTVGHNAMIHNCSIGDYAVIGMNSTIADFSEVGEWAIIGEHSLVKRGQIVPPKKIYAGVPSVEKGDILEKHITEWISIKKMYQESAAKYKTEIKKLS